MMMQHQQVTAINWEPAQYSPTCRGGGGGGLDWCPMNPQFFRMSAHFYLLYFLPVNYISNHFLFIVVFSSTPTPIASSI